MDKASVYKGIIRSGFCLVFSKGLGPEGVLSAHPFSSTCCRIWPSLTNGMLPPPHTVALKEAMKQNVKEVLLLQKTVHGLYKSRYYMFKLHFFNIHLLVIDSFIVILLNTT